MVRLSVQGYNITLMALAFHEMWYLE